MCFHSRPSVLKETRNIWGVQGKRVKLEVTTLGQGYRGTESSGSIDSKIIAAKNGSIEIWGKLTCRHGGREDREMSPGRNTESVCNRLGNG
jgi:hypothetical protein